MSREARGRAPRLIIIGRPNVGKSTLFNRLLGRRRALVHDEPGVTRDRLIEKAEWTVKGRKFPVTLIDTGGLGGDRWAAEIEQQVKMGLEEADIAIVLFDGKAGLTAHDRDVILKLKQSGLLDSKRIRTIGVVNKIDHANHEDLLNDFYETGLDPLLTISAEHDRGIDDLREAVFEAAVAGEPSLAADSVTGAESDPDGGGEAEEADDLSHNPYAPPGAGVIPRIAIVGRPNVGKSTMVNALLGEKRMIASPIAGTTVDAVDSEAIIDEQKFILIDTAGIRRKSKTEQGVEVLSVVQARKALERCDVAILLIDGEEGVTDQDEKIGGLIEEVGCGVIIAVNKWDTQKGKQGFSREDAAKIVREEMAFLRYAPILFTSGKFGRGFEGLADLVNEILSQRRVKVATKELSEWVRNAATIHNPNNAKFYLCHQSGRHPPTFVCHVSDPDKIHFSLRRHLMNGIREKWGFMGSPVRLLFMEAKSTRKADPKKARASMSNTQRGHQKASEEARRQRNKARRGR